MVNVLIPFFFQIVTLFLCPLNIPIRTAVIISCGGNGTGKLRHIANQSFLMNQIIVITAREFSLQQAPICLVTTMIYGKCHGIILFCRFKIRAVLGICGKLHDIRKKLPVAPFRIVFDNPVKYTRKTGNHRFIGHTLGTCIDSRKYTIQILAPAFFIRAIP